MINVRLESDKQESRKTVTDIMNNLNKRMDTMNSLMSSANLNAIEERVDGLLMLMILKLT